MIRLAQPTDLQRLVEIRQQAILVLGKQGIDEQRAREWANLSRFEHLTRVIEGHIEQADVWVAERNNATVGWVETRENRVERMYVDPALAGCGIGSSLLLHAEKKIHERGYHAAYLDASPNAEGFYFYHHYCVAGERSAQTGCPMRKTPIG